jgi:hypothetical protein
MSTLTEIEIAAEKLPLEQVQELILFLGMRLRRAGAAVPPPRKFSREQVDTWVAEDEEEMKQFREDS